MIMTTTTLAHPLLTQEGVLFTVRVDSVGRDCIVTHDALQALSHLKPTDDADMMALFHAYEAKISGIARRLVGANVPGNPLRMNPATFTAPYTA
jgi:hypothetical protein